MYNKFSIQGYWRYDYGMWENLEKLRNIKYDLGGGGDFSDCNDEIELEKSIANAYSKFGSIDGLVNCAAIDSVPTIDESYQFENLAFHSPFFLTIL